MATIADQLLGIAQSAQKAPDISGAISQGAELAKNVQSIKESRAKLEEAKQNMMIQKADKIMQAIEKGSNFKDKAAQNQYFKNYIPGMIKALKMEDFFTADLMPYVQESQEVRNKLIGLRLDIQDKINRGQLQGARILEYAKSKLTPEELPLLDTDALLEQQKFAYQQEASTERAKYTAEATTERAQEARAATGDVEAQKKVSQEWATWEAGGGEASWDKTADIFRDAIKDLQSGKVKFGTWSKKIPWVGSNENVLAITDPKAKELIDNIRGGINIREKTGDPNPATTQIDAILARAIDPRLSNEANIRKLETELKAMEVNRKNKVDVFRRFGHIPVSASAKVRSEVKQANQTAPKKFSDFSPERQEYIVNKMSKQTGRSPKEIREELEAQ